MADPQLMTGLGAALSVFFSSVGAANGSCNAGNYLVHSKDGGIRAFAPIMVSGVLAIYGMIMAMILCGNLKDKDMTVSAGYTNFAAGLTVGLACLASGIGMGSFIYYEVSESPREVPARTGGEQQQPLLGRPHSEGCRSVSSPSINFLLVLVFLEAIGLYGLIVGLFLADI